MKINGQKKPERNYPGKGGDGGAFAKPVRETPCNVLPRRRLALP